MELPTRLASEPLVEVVSELRFDATGDSAINLLPGILHEQFGPFNTQTRALVAAFPPEVIASDPSLAYRPQLILVKDNRIIQVGTKMISVACRAPYPGWSSFSKFVRSVFEVVSRQSFISSFNWVSLKYVDVIAFADEVPTLDWLDADLRLDSRRIEGQPCSLRVEHVDGAVTTITQLVCPVLAEQTGFAPKRGVLVDVDTIHREEFSAFAQQFPEVLEQLHRRNKLQFFSLLTDETLRRLGPEYP